MPIPTAIPTVNPTPSATIVGQKCILAFLPDSGVQKNFRAKVAGLSRSTSKLQRKVPDTDGSLIPDRTVYTEKTTSLKLTLDEFTADTLIFLNNAYVKGTARLWVKDPDDAVNTAALSSNEFACTISMDGDVQFQSDQFAEFGVTVDVNGAFTLAADASTT